jgi:poly(3-hydroxybutyrate) depolymerase
MFDDGPPRTWTDPTTGGARAACVYRPAGATPASPRPLVVFFHGGGGSATDIYDATSLRAKAGYYGFLLAADQGRYLSWPNRPGGPVHDFYYRDFTTHSSNPDVRNADRLIDDLVAEGGVDESRIFVMGWSNGGWFGEAYAIARFASPTPGGHFVAGVAVYSSGNPFENISDTQSPTCARLAAPHTTVPLLLVHRACDINGCNEAQRRLSGQPPGANLADWISTLQLTLGDPTVEDILVDGQGQQATACTPIPPCSSDYATLNHLRWPDGVADQGHHDWELRMLSFLQEHPRQ